MLQPIHVLRIACAAFALGSTGCLAPKEMPASNPMPGHTVAVALHHASALDVADTLNELVAASHAASEKRANGTCVLYTPGNIPKVSPFVPIARADRESNVVIVQVEAPEEAPRLRELLARLDVPR